MNKAFHISYYMSIAISFFQIALAGLSIARGSGELYYSFLSLGFIFSCIALLTSMTLSRIAKIVSLLLFSLFLIAVALRDAGISSLILNYGSPSDGLFLVVIISIGFVLPIVGLFSGTYLLVSGNQTKS